MLQRVSCVILLIVLAASLAIAQQTIFWKKDHVYFGPGGKEMAVVTPAPTDQTAPTTPSSATLPSIRMVRCHGAPSARASRTSHSEMAVVMMSPTTGISPISPSMP